MLIEQEFIKKPITWKFIKEIYKIIISRINYPYELEIIFFTVRNLIIQYDFTNNEWLLHILNNFIEVYCDKKIDENLKIDKFIQIRDILANAFRQINYDMIEDLKV